MGTSSGPAKWRSPIAAALALALRPDQHNHFPDVPVLLHELMGRRTLGPWEDAREHRLDLALGDQLVRALALVGVGEVAPEDRLLAHPEVADVEVEQEPRRGAADDHRP